MVKLTANSMMNNNTNSTVNVTAIANALTGQKILGAAGKATIIRVNCGNNRITLQLAGRQVSCTADQLLEGTWSVSKSARDALEEIVKISVSRAAKSASKAKTKRSAKTTSRQKVPFTGKLLLLAKKSRLKMQGIDLSKLYKQYSQATPATKATIWYDFANCERNIQIAREISQYKDATQRSVWGLLISQETATSPWVIGAIVKLQALKYPHRTFTVEKVFQCNVPAKGYLSSAQFKFGPIDRNGNLVEGAISCLDDTTYLTMVQNASQGNVSQGSASKGIASQGSVSQGSASQGIASQGIVNQGTASQGTASQGTASQGTASQGTASQGTASQGNTQGNTKTTA